MPINRKTAAWDHPAIVSNAGFLVDFIFVGMEIIYVGSDLNTACIDPGPFSDAVTSVDCRLAIGRLCTQVGSPSLFARTCFGSQRLAMLVSTR